MTSERLQATGGVVTEALKLRPVRLRDDRAELDVLSVLAQDLAADPERVQARVVEQMVSLGMADSAGVSLIDESEPQGSQCWFRWHAVAGAWAGYQARRVPFERSPCSVAVSANTPQLMASPQSRFPGWRVDPPAEETLILPLEIQGRVVGALWAISHDPRHLFDAEDLASMARFGHLLRASHRTLRSIDEVRAVRKAAGSGMNGFDHSLASVQSAPFQELCASIDEAYCAIEVQFDARSEAVDAVIRDANPAFRRITGIEAPIGRRLGEVGFLGDRQGLSVYVDVALSGKPQHFELPVGTNRLFRGYVFRIGDPMVNQVAVLFQDITDRTTLVEALRASEAQQAFLLRFSDALRPLSDPLEIQAEAARSLGEYLAADRTFYSEVNPASGALACRREHVRFESGGVRAAFPMASWSSVFERLREGSPVVEEDVAASMTGSEEERAALRANGVHSFLAVPLVKQGRLIAAMTACQGRARPWHPDEIWLVQEIAECTWAAVERTRAAVALRESEERFRKLTNAVPAIVWLAAPDGSLIFASERGRKFEGLTLEEARGNGWRQALHPDDVTRVETAWAEACEKGTSFEVEGRHRLRSDGTYRWQLSRAEPMRNEAGVITCWFGSTTDIDDLRRLQEHQKLLLAELQHRVRNTLAVVRSIARRTATTSETIESFAANFEGRLDAFARTQAVVTRDPSKGVSLDYIVAEELLAFAAHERAGGREGGQLQIEGPEVRFQPKAAETFALAVHELATNAIKHGALAACGTGRGRLAVKWHIETGETADGPRRLVFSWIESRLGTTIAAPSRRGFGMELLERTLQYELKARTTLLFEPKGLRCTIAMPLTSRVSWQGLGR